MFQIPPHNLLPDHMHYVRAIGTYLQPAEQQPSIAAAEQQKLIAKLEANCTAEKFCWIVDVASNNIVRSKGLEQLLGFGHASLSTRAYAQLIHPAHSLAQSLHSYALLEVLGKEQTDKSVVRQLVHVSLLALQSKDGQYIYFKKESRPVQVSESGKILQYASEYMIVKPFHHEAYSIRLYDGTGHRPDLEQKVAGLVKKYFERLSGFTTQELRILKRYARGGKQVTSEEIAYSFKIEKSTVSVHNKRILDKTEHLLEHRLDNAQKAAAYFKAMGML